MFYAENDSVAHRVIQLTMKNAPADILPKQYPMDFALVRLGAWSDSKGIVSVEQNPVNLGSVYSILKPVEDLTTKEVVEKLNEETKADESNG